MSIPIVSEDVPCAFFHGETLQENLMKLDADVLDATRFIPKMFSDTKIAKRIVAQDPIGILNNSDIILFVLAKMEMRAGYDEEYLEILDVLEKNGIKLE